MSWSNRIQQAVYNALIASTALDALLPRHNQLDRMAVYGQVPQPADSGNNALFPLITIGEDTVADWATDTESGADATVSVHIWSRSSGWAEAKTIAGAVYAALHRQTLTVPTGIFIGCDFVSDRNLRDPDGKTLHIVSDYRILADEVEYPYLFSAHFSEEFA